MSKEHKPGELFNKLHGKKEKKHEKNWIAGAIKHPGALKKTLGVKAGNKIPSKKLSATAKKGGVTGKRARLVETLKSFHHKSEKTHEAHKSEHHKMHKHHKSMATHHEKMAKHHKHDPMMHKHHKTMAEHHHKTAEHHKKMAEAC